MVKRRSVANVRCQITVRVDCLAAVCESHENCNFSFLGSEKTCTVFGEK